MIGTRGVIAVLVVALSASAVRAQPVLTDWAGTWSAGEEQEISIVANKKSLGIEGFATWGASDPERVERGGVNVGEFSVTVPRSWIEDNRLVFIAGDEGAEPVGMVADDYACLIEMMLDGEVLRVGDNMMCGGMNVTFSGEYRRE
ncbi:hypothetical protein [Devosia rhizoryzae]|uniref:Uncharacterized protein n=1 Tax=Devosia rhizoryzae TaxID=2774137 RepID=A0ABX7C2J7_9HYPH|nr:hypothetical protein [Devosia rhizoryzae]QQR37967.1 hypothetical protein JI748_09130 [Devosia rhizoryzae]